MASLAAGLLAIAAASVMATPVALAKTTDDRVAEERLKGTPMGAIGMVLRLDGDGAEAGTAFLVSPCHILTAAHVVAGRDGISESQVLLFFAGSGNLGPRELRADFFGALSPARPLVWGDYREGDTGSTAERIAAFRSNSWNDWALLKLDRCVGDEGFGYLGLLPITTGDFMRQGGRRAVTAVGMPADRANDTLTVDPACTLLGQVEAAGWQHDCTTMPGNSGGPVLAARNEPGEKWPRVLAITVASVAAAESDHGGMTPQLIDPVAPNYFDLLATAVPVSAFLPEIVPYLPEDSRIAAYLAQHRDDLATGDRGYDVEEPGPAIEDISLALERQANDPMLLMRRGQWHQAADDQVAALADYDAALQADPNFSPALRGRALLRAARDDKMQDDAALAKADLDRLIARFPDLADLRIERGGLLSGSYDFAPAILDFDAVLKAEPTNALALLSRAHARLELGDIKGAGADYDAAVAARSDFGFVYVQRAHYLARIERIEAAFADIERALEIEPDMPSAINARAIIYLHGGDADVALVESDRAVTLDPESGPAVALRGSIKHVLGDLEGAIADYRRASELDPSEPFDAMLLFIALGEAGRAEEGRAELRKLLARWPADEWPAPLARHLLGEMDAAALKERAAIGNDILRAYQEFDRHFYLGIAALIAGDEKTARALLEQAVKMDLSQFLEFDIARAYLERLGGPAYLKKGS
ncbi:MAG: trypsin-like peptidase domain-containing protein [Rhodospirillaceae bacterium]|nr:trypsin-like peptidase domain-containing protein [Rhodospirillaceae bacterium]